MRVAITTRIAAPVETCFDLARDLDFHLESMASTGERAVAGRTTGLIAVDEEVTWEARHFGRLWRMTVRIEEMDRPRSFRDVMICGPFARFGHSHCFSRDGSGTLMHDRIEFASPFGPLGWLADRLVVGCYLRRLLTGRAEAIRQAAERALRQG